MFKFFDNIFNKNKSSSAQKSKDIRLYALSKDEKNTMLEYSYKNITEAIEATKGYEYYIFESHNDKSICKGKWKEYILQK